MPARHRSSCRGDDPDLSAGTLPVKPNRRGTLVREQIFSRAMTLFERKGFRATSMQDIADACGVTKPAIYYYVKSKYELLQTLYDIVTLDFYDAGEALVRSELSPDDKLRRLIRAQVTYSAEHKQFQRLFLSERREFDRGSIEALARRERRYERMLQEVIEEGQRAGLFRDIDARLVMLSILGLLSSVHRWVNYAGSQPETVASGIIDLVMSGLAAPQPPGRRRKTTGAG